jgi:hypothetical protein
VVIVNGSVQADEQMYWYAGCSQLSDADGRPGEYSYLALATSPE